MTGTKILWGQMLGALAMVLLGCWAATEWTAWRLGFQPALGLPWVRIGAAPVYQPQLFFAWWYHFDAYAPGVFAKGAVIASAGGLGAALLAIAASVLRARQARHVTTYGSAHWATRHDIEAAGLFGDAGVQLGRLGAQTLRHDGPEHVLCFAPTRSGKGVGLVVPTLLSWTGSVIVHDIKGENWTLTAGWRAQFSHCLLFDPTNPRSAAYNPLLEVRRGEWEVRDVQNIADVLVDPEGALERRHWWAKRKGIAALLREVIWQQETQLVDSDAENQSADADAALQELGSDAVSFGYFSATVTVWDTDEAAAIEKVRLVGRAVRGQGFVAVEETLNAVEAWLGSLPGQCYANIRQPLVSSLNLVHMLPLSAVWAGPERNAHLDGPPLLVAHTAGSTPFRLVLHQGDVGHTLIVGPTGAGKSVLLALIALQFRRYPSARVVVFDKGRSSKAAVLGMGGAFHDLALGGDLSREQHVAFQPLARIDEAAERAWAADWIATLLVQENIELTPEVRGAIWSALGSLATAPVPERTLSGFAALLQANRLKSALEPYTIAGPFGRLLDAEQESVGDADVLAFETEDLLGSKHAARAVLTYLFHRIEAELDGRPTLIAVDEAWFALDDPVFAPKLREWLKTLRRKNASVLFSTQSLADITRSPVAPAVIESSLSRIFLPNARAIEPESRDAYPRLGLNDRQIETIARGPDWAAALIAAEVAIMSSRSALV